MRGRSPVRALYALACLTVAALGAACSPDDPSREAPTPGPGETTLRGTPEEAIAAWLRCEECVDGEREAILAVAEAAVPALRDALLDGPPERERLEWEADMRSLHARIRSQADARGLAVADVDEFVDRRVGNLVLRYRGRAADALGWIGGPRARAALEEAVRAESRGGRLLERIQAVLDSM
jgi:hypothetical protein